MAQMKDFARWLSKCVFDQRLEDETIKEYAKHSWGVHNYEWMQKQINYVRSHPKDFKERIH
jgi:hypothetical protein